MDTIIDWTSQESHILLNPKTPPSERAELLNALESVSTFPAHIWLATSGTSGFMKWTALSKEALLHSAQAVNDHLSVTKNDIWMNSLPTFHVGGLSVLARGFVSGAKLVAYKSIRDKWDALDYVKQLRQTKASLTSMVCSQVYDMVNLKIKAPGTLRAVIVGGGELSENLYLRGRELGWNLLPSYGMTECSSQIATASLDSLREIKFPTYVPLKHIEFKLNKSKCLVLKSPSLLSAYATKSGNMYKIVDPKIDGWFQTEDKPRLMGNNFLSVSRNESFIKISGESVDVTRLDRILEQEQLDLGINEDVAIVPLEDGRRGWSIHLAVVYGGSGDMEALVKKFNSRVFPYERIVGVNYVNEIPRSPTKKVLRKKLAQIINT